MKSVKYSLTLLALLCTTALWSQTATAAGVTPAADAAGSLGGIMTNILVIAGALLFIVAMIYVVKVNQFLYKRVLALQAQQSGVTLPEGSGLPEAPAAGAGDDFWTNLRKKYWEDAVPQEREHEILSHHGFDGIHELDNSLPPWWVGLFIVTVIWAAIYMFYYHWGGGGPSSTDEYNRQIEIAKKEMIAGLASKANAIDETNVTALTESGALADGELIYKTNCAACHGQKGEGGVGPNMTDDYWIHGGGIKNIFKTVKVGVPEKGMISWAAQLKPSDMQKVSSYILTLHGTNPPNAKEPQGDIWKEEAAPAAADTTKVSG